MTAPKQIPKLSFQHTAPSWGEPGYVSVEHGYLWVGSDRHCFGYYSGNARLRRFALTLLAKVGTPSEKDWARKHVRHVKASTP